MADRAEAVIALALVALGAFYAYSAGWFTKITSFRSLSPAPGTGPTGGPTAEADPRNWLNTPWYQGGLGGIIQRPGGELPPALPQGPVRVFPNEYGTDGSGAVLAGYGGPGLLALQDPYGGYHAPYGTPPLVPGGYGHFPPGYQQGGYPQSPWWSPWQGYGRQGQPEPTNDSAHPLGGGVPPGGRPQCAVWHPGCASVVHTGSNTVDSIVSVGSTIAKFLGFG